ncbi:MAG: TVP38/TMEM64 family protein [Neomegalonema sp.]|nr:TVP38/TMEM64 family protein [Neomegalonema sp.]
MSDAKAQSQNKQKKTWLRWAPLILLAGAALFAYSRWGHYLSFEALADNRDALIAWRDANYMLAALVYMSAYMLVVAFSIPGALWMTLAGGFLFGVWPGAPMIIVAATLGALVVFLVARGSFGAAFRERAGPWMQRFERGFAEDAASYLLIMRLTPIAPFFVVNVAPALLGVPTRTYLWTTLVGIAPATIVYSWVGSGLGAALSADAIAAGDVAGVIFRPEILGPILGLAVLAALPIVIKRFRRKAETS